METLRNIKVIQGLPYNVPEIIDITDTLPSKTPDMEPRKAIADVTYISVHHSAVEGGTIQGYADYHVKTLGWFHIGYHIVVKGGQMYQTNDLLTKSYHTSGNNHYTVGISVSGDLSKRSLTPDEKNNLYTGILTLMSIFNIPAEHVLGHREFHDNNTSCPGLLDMNQLRNDIKNLQMSLQKQDTWAVKMKSVADIVNEINYLTDIMKKGESDGNAAWAANAFFEVADMMRSKYLL
jgi:hypothetical protein